MKRPNLARCAHFYLDMGWSFYPTRPRSKSPYTEICPRWKPYQIELPTRDEARFWFEQIAPDANIALITGAVSNLVIIDLDTPAAVDEFCALLGADSIRDIETPRVQSSRGWHLYFARPDAADVRGEIGIADCDVKADGGCCTAPPSIHQSGRQYRFDLSPHRAPLLPLPAPVLERLALHHAARAAKRNALVNSSPMPSLSGLGCGKYGQAALKSALDELSLIRHERNKALNAKAYAIGRIVGAGALDVQTAQAALTHAALNMGLLPGEIGPTINSGLEHGMANPRIIADRATPTTRRPLPSLAQMRGAI